LTDLNEVANQSTNKFFQAVKNIRVLYLAYFCEFIENKMVERVYLFGTNSTLNEAINPVVKKTLSKILYIAPLRKKLKRS